MRSLTPLFARAILAFALLASINSSVARADISFSFSGLDLAGFNFIQMIGNASGDYALGTLTEVQVDAVLDASVNDTWADDLTIYVAPEPLDVGGLLQVGGFNSLGASERHFWDNGDSGDPGTLVIDSQILTNQIVFNGNASDPAIWLGNGYGVPGTSGTWTGTVTLVGINAVPEPSTAGLILGVGGLLATCFRRRKS